MAGSSQAWTLKIQLNGEVRRLRGWPETECEPTIEALRSAIRGLFDLTLAQDEALSLKYEDDEGDTCTLVEASLPDALSFATQRGVLRIIAACSPSRRSLSREVVVCETILPFAPAEAHPHSESAEVFEDAESEAPPASHESDEQQEPTEAPCNTSERLSEVFRGITQHLESARPHIAEGVAHFNQQVVADFQSTSADMKDAFGARAQHTQVLGPVCTVVGATAGIISAARLVPVRATRLAAASVSVIAGGDAPSADNDGVADEQTDEQGAISEFGHLKQQVTNDFCTVQQDLNTAFRCILGGSEAAASESSEQDSQEPQPSPLQTLKIAIPSVVSTLVGGSVAACLLPVRATRFAIASLASSLSAAPAGDVQ